MATARQQQQQKKQANKLLWYMKTPMRVLRRARDFYVDTIVGCASRRTQYGGAFMSGRPMPRSYSLHTPARSSTSDDDYRELIRAVSQGTYGSLNLNRAGAGGAKHIAGTTGVVPRSQSVAIGRIDEDSAVDFSGDFKLGVPGGPAYPRSRSCAVPGPANWSRIAAVA